MGVLKTMTQSSQGWTAANLPQNGRKRKESMRYNAVKVQRPDRNTVMGRKESCA